MRTSHKAQLRLCLFLLAITALASGQVQKKISISIATTAQPQNEQDLSRGLHVMINGTPTTATISEASEAPLDLVVVIDASNSQRESANRTYGTHAADLQLLAQQVIHKGKDRITVVAFESLPEELASGDEPGVVKKAFSRLQMGGGTALYDALLRAVKIFRRDALARRAVIVISDGDDKHSTHSASDANTMLLEEGAVVYFFVQNKDTNTGSLKTIGEISTSTGGRVLAVSKQQDLATGYAQVLYDLQRQFLVSFSAPPELPRHRPIPLTVSIDGRLVQAPQQLALP
jgi:Mg-chelatase subunit ChlD